MMTLPFPSRRTLFVVVATLAAIGSTLPVAGSVDPTASPVTVAPGAADRLQTVAHSCPTFHWAGVDGAKVYELYVFAVSPQEREASAPGPVLSQSLPGGLGSWTPSRSSCLAPGMYDWYLRAQVEVPEGSAAWTPWSRPLFFEVDGRELPTERVPAASFQGDGERVSEGREVSDRRSAGGVSREPRVTLPARRKPRAAPSPSTQGNSFGAIRGEIVDGNQNGFGVIADSNGGGGLWALGPAGGPDIVLDGSRDGVPTAFLSQGGWRMLSAQTMSFDFDNPGGDFDLLVKGVEVVTTETDQDTLASLSCQDGEIAEFESGDWECASAGGGGWLLGGNPGAVPGDFLGTLDTVPLELRVNDQAALRVQWGDGTPGPSGPNIVAGAAQNSIPGNIYGATIAGGGVGTAPNTVTALGGTIGGGLANSVQGANGTISGGSTNTTSGQSGTVAGGSSNVASGDYSAIPGGRNNIAAGSDSLAAGRQAQALHANSFVFNDGGGNFSTTASSQFLVDVSDGVGIGTNTPSDLLHVSAPAGKSALRVQVDGTTRLRVHDNGGVSVGANTTPPVGGMRVAGDLWVDGQVFLSNAPTRWASYAAIGFPCNSSRCGVPTTGTRLACTISPDCRHRVPVHLPHGATMNAFEMRTDDLSATDGVTIYLRRVTLATGDVQFLAELHSDDVAQGNGVIVSDTSISGAVIDNEDYAYYFEVFLDQQASVALYWVRIAYDHSGDLP